MTGAVSMSPSQLFRLVARLVVARNHDDRHADAAELEGFDGDLADAASVEAHVGDLCGAEGVCHDAVRGASHRVVAEEDDALVGLVDDAEEARAAHDDPDAARKLVVVERESAGRDAPDEAAVVDDYLVGSRVAGGLDTGRRLVGGAAAVVLGLPGAVDGDGVLLAGDGTLTLAVDADVEFQWSGSQKGARISAVGQFTSFALSLSKGNSRFDKLTANGFRGLYDTPCKNSPTTIPD